MILVLVTALALGLGIPLSRLSLKDIDQFQPRIFLLGSFFLLVGFKLCLLIGLRARRHQADHPGDADSDSGSGRETL